jgi:hypothetical protein
MQTGSIVSSGSKSCEASAGVMRGSLIDCAGRMLPYEQPNVFGRAVSEFLAALRRPLTSFSGDVAQNVAPEAR